MSAISTVAPVRPVVAARRAGASGPVRRPVRAGRPASSPGPGLRLTRRGRLVITLLVTALLAVAVVAGAASVSARTAEPLPASTVEVVVQPGQTLWQLAEEVAPGADPREVVRQVRELNGLSGSSVLPGQSLVVPVGRPGA